MNHMLESVHAASNVPLPLDDIEDISRLGLTNKQGSGSGPRLTCLALH